VSILQKNPFFIYHNYIFQEQTFLKFDKLLSRISEITISWSLFSFVSRIGGSRIGASRIWPSD